MSTTVETDIQDLKLEVKPTDVVITEEVHQPGDNADVAADVPDAGPVTTSDDSDDLNLKNENVTSDDHDDDPKEVPITETPKPVLSIPFPYYLSLGVLISVSICATVNGLLATNMYSPETAKEEFTHETQTFAGPPNTLAGETLITALVQTVVTFILSGGLAMRDRKLNGHPLNITGKVWPEFIRKDILSRMPKQYALLGPYLSSESGAESQISDHDVEDVYYMDFVARVKGTLISSLKLFGVVMVLFVIPLILVLWIIFDIIIDQTWDQNSVVLLKIIPFQILQISLQSTIAAHGFYKSSLDY